MNVYKVEQIENPNNTLTAKPGQFWKNDGGMWCVRLESSAGLSVRRYLRKWQAEERADKAIERQNKIEQTKLISERDQSKKAAHTPGPWHMDYHTSIFSQCPAVYTKNNEPVAHVIYGNTDDSAREAAFLISAAPELLTALCDFEDAMQEVSNRMDATSRTRMEQVSMLARSAIAKAKGK